VPGDGGQMWIAMAEARVAVAHRVRGAQVEHLDDLRLPGPIPGHAELDGHVLLVGPRVPTEAAWL
jgi:hypothetical protein